MKDWSSVVEKQHFIGKHIFSHNVCITHNAMGLLPYESPLLVFNDQEVVKK